mmetsp:Transcript_29163/g.44092  ORF Transcript_29163/g.44092 Transcript_29163/m.44092 type:complete len:216 (+) Transcript_29163:69-716(+)|eukprot:CAMPEP_0178917776 /NCGR_PEP_ID=MMETSP0786-20121207/13441_1 /TAXON_ID=186022 /ORGANISM="Thalassionema frauenfeldii, Strain CCMP 1798" /LENGTH=215 /DNA_ID=CAMNT_0020591377 /DNA_START=60 /DNA_END=707 /DNA_ORIENTATION=-
MQKLFFLLSIIGVTAAFVVQKGTVRPSTAVKENFGFDFAEDSYANTPDIILGERNYKNWVQKTNDNSFLNRRYNALRRVRELDLLKATAENGILSKLEKNGVDLVTIEKLLPTIEELGLVGAAAENQQLLINALAFLAIEGAPFLLPVVAGALEAGPSAFYLAAATTGGLEAFFIASDTKLPLVGLDASFALGLILVPLTVVFAGLGTALASAKK